VVFQFDSVVAVISWYTCSFRRWSRSLHMHHKPNRDCFRQPEVSSGE